MLNPLRSNEEEPTIRSDEEEEELLPLRGGYTAPSSLPSTRQNGNMGGSYEGEMERGANNDLVQAEEGTIYHSSGHPMAQLNGTEHGK